MKFFWMVFFLCFSCVLLLFGMTSDRLPDWLRIMDTAIFTWNFWAMIMNTVWWLDSMTEEE